MKSFVKKDFPTPFLTAVFVIFQGVLKKEEKMNKKLIIAAGAFALALTGCDQFCPQQAKKTTLVTEKDKYSYALGAHFGNQAHFQL
ncbi:MAG: hypothetical protein HUK19_05290, partial [Fibrobacter sp.]|nr:hypothetical protein [Fibrobacter sp.]